MKAFVLCLLAVAIFLTALDVSNAQTWPAKPVRIIVPFPPGGNSDAIARATADQLQKRLNAPFIVDNKPGASGEIAAQHVAKSAPDGYTLLWATLPQMGILPVLKATSYDPVKDFAPITIVASNPLALAVNPSFPAKTLAEFVDHIKAQPNKFSFASAGSGSVSHLAMALLMERADLKIVHVPYKGGVPAITDVVAGHVPIGFGNLIEVTPHAKTGAIRLLAVTSEHRTTLAPDLPTIAELGYPGYRVETWNGLAAPQGTAADIIARIAGVVATAVKDRDFVARLESFGVTPIGNGPDEFSRIIKLELKTWAEAVQISGAKVQ